jgi:hypothetical protein
MFENNRRIYPHTDRPLLTGRFMVEIHVKGSVGSRVIVRLEGLGKLKNGTTLLGIEPATFRFVPQFLKKRLITRPKSCVI